VNEEVGRIEQGWIQLTRSEQFLGIFSNKACDPGQANQKLLCGLHSRKSSKILSFLNSRISRISQISSKKKKHKKLFELKSTHRALDQNLPPHWRPEEEEKPISDHQRNLIRENSFIYCRAVDRTSRFSFLF
jgi:hypothetical protein